MDIKTVQIVVVVKADESEEAAKLMVNSLHMNAYVVSTTVSDSTEAETESYAETFGDDED